MPVPERSRPDGAPLSPEERRRVTRSAALRPINVLMLVIGGVFFAATLAWWVPVLTVATYGLLVFLAARDPLFQSRVLEGRSAPSLRTSSSSTDSEVPPERRARWLPRGETRQKVEEALVSYRKTVRAIEEADEVTRAVLDDAVPKLHAAAERLVDVADRREKAAGTIRDLEAAEPNEERQDSLRELESEVRAADAEISGTSEQFLNIRARVVRVSIDSGTPARVAAEELKSSLDGLNLRLAALSETMSPAHDPRPDTREGQKG